MKTGPFLMIVAAVLILGAVLGGAFAAGLALGRSQVAEAQGAFSTTRSLTQPFGGQRSPEELQQLRERLASGDLSEEERQQLRQQFQGRAGQGAQGLRGLGLTATIQKVEGRTLTLEAPQGTIEVTLGEGTTIQRLAEGSVTDLAPGQRVRLTGQRAEDGTLQVQTVLLNPPDQGLFGREAIP